MQYVAPLKATYPAMWSDTSRNLVKVERSEDQQFVPAKREDHLLLVNSYAIRKKHLCFLKKNMFFYEKKNMFFMQKKLGLQKKKHSKSVFFLNTHLK